MKIDHLQSIQSRNRVELSSLHMGLVEAKRLKNAFDYLEDTDQEYFYHNLVQWYKKAIKQRVAEQVDVKAAIKEATAIARRHSMNELWVKSRFAGTDEIYE